MFNDDADDYLDPYEDRLHLVTRLIGLTLLLGCIAFGIWLVRHITWPWTGCASASPTTLIRSTSCRMPRQELREIELALLAGKHEVAAVFAREQEFSRFCQP